MQVGQFPASAANSLIQGYCDDFVSLAAILAQTLEQISMRGLHIEGSRPALQRIESGMRNLADAIQELLNRGMVTTDLSPSKDSGHAPTAMPHAHAQAQSPAPAQPAAHSHTHAQPQPQGQAHAQAHPQAQPHAQPQRAPGNPASTRASSPPAPTRAPTTPPANSATPRPASPPPQPAPRVQPSISGASSARHPAPPARLGATGSSTAIRKAPARTATEGLKGTSQSMPLLSVFQFLGRMRKAGTMRVEIASETLTFELQNGCILATTSSHTPPPETLGELLVELGFCDSDQLDPVTVAAGAGGGVANDERFGQLAIEAGVVREPQVVAALELQATRRYGRSCKSPDARYEFLEGLSSTREARFRTPPIPVA